MTIFARRRCQLRSKVVAVFAIAMVLTAASGSRAARFFFSPLGYPDGPCGVLPLEDCDPFTVPTFGLYNDATLHLWFLPDRELERNVTFNAISWDVVTGGNQGAHPTVSLVANPPNEFAEVNRWTIVNPGIVSAPGEDVWIENARAVAIAGNPGIGRAAAHVADGARDAKTGAFYLGSLGAQANYWFGGAGLYLRVGRSGISATGPAPPPNIYFGDSATPWPAEPGAGDPIVPNLAEADAIVYSTQWGIRYELLERRIRPENRGAAQVFSGPTGHEVIPIAPRPWTGAFAGLFQNWQDDFFDVYLDVVGLADPTYDDQVAFALANSRENDGRVVSNVRGTYPLGGDIDYDVRIRYAMVPGTSPQIDFDLSPLLPSGFILQNVAVANDQLAIPEPFGQGWIGFGAIIAIGVTIRARRRRAPPG